MRKTLNGKWVFNSNFLEQFNLKDLSVTVPGSIYNDLLKYNLIDEPYYRANEVKMLDLMKYDYAYSRTFKITSSNLGKEVSLFFKGLDTVCEIYVNDRLVAKTFNMHRRYHFVINEFIHEGANKLEVVIKSCLDFIDTEYKKQTHELMNMQYAVKGYATIRKAHCMFGWDWGPQMPDGGIWRDCYLEIVDKAKIESVQVFQDTNKQLSKLFIEVNNHVVKNKNLEVKLSLTHGEKETVKVVKLDNNNKFYLEIKNPKLWYPVGYGSQELYDLKVTILSNNRVVDEYKEAIGLRKVEVRRIPDEYGESFTVCVNDQPIFIKGSDYIIEDNILPRSNMAHTEFLLKAAIEANQNCLRIWGGALYPSDEFFALCDRLGILIWQDLMFACGYYNMENEFFVNEITEEIKDNITRIHNHPCIILICGNNENETAALNWNVPNPEYTKKWYLYQYEELIPSILKEVAPDIFFWPSSPSSGGGFNDPNADGKGDMHYWGVWHNDEPIENYRIYYPRMLSEFGMQSFPCMKTIREFTLEEDRNIYSYVMERHQKNRSANQKIMNYIGSMFKYPKDLENIAYVSELIQAEAVRYCVEHLRRNYGRCMGSIYWQLNDCWPVASWSSIDYYNRYKALQYYSKRFYAPVIVSIEETNTMNAVYTLSEGYQTAKIVVTNETDKLLNGNYTWMLVDFNGNIVKQATKEYQVAPYSKEDLEEVKFNLSLEEQTSLTLRVKLNNADGSVYENYANFVRDKYLNLAKPIITYRLDRDGNNYSLKLISNTYAKYVCVDAKKTDLIFSDNYFNLYKDEEKVITFTSIKEIKEKNLKVISLTDSF